MFVVLLWASELTRGEWGGSAGVADGRWHGLVAQAELRAAVKVVSAQHRPSSLPVTFAPVVPAFQMFRHQSFLHVFGQ